jgi:alginate production protein
VLRFCVLRTTALIWFLAAGLSASAQDEVTVQELEVGHWVVISGELTSTDHFLADEIEVLHPDDEESLVGRISDLRFIEGGHEFRVLGQRVVTNQRTDLPEGPLEDGQLVRVEGHFEGRAEFIAGQVRVRQKGRERVEGRVDWITRKGDVIELRVQRFLVTAKVTEKLELEAPMAGLEFAPQQTRRVQRRRMREEDQIPGRPYGPDLFLGFRAETKMTDEDNFNLRDSDGEDRFDFDSSIKAEMTWAPPGNFSGVASARFLSRSREDQDEGPSNQDDARLVEVFGYWDEIPGGFEVQLGRQDFEEQREWLWDQELDALRVAWSRGNHRLEVAAFTSYSDASDRDLNSNNLLAYYSWEESDRILAAYLVDRRILDGGRDYPFHMGVRALGEWLPDSNVWLELSHLTGYRGTDDLRAWGMDGGLVWEPDALSPFHFSLGWAVGSGDSTAGDGVDSTFHQTGYQDNNDKLGGATSVKYYGELLEPELSNIAIMTASAGITLGKRTSLDLIWHDYTQVESDVVRVGSLGENTNGVYREIGWGLDLVLGSRYWRSLDLEFVLSHFQPGNAYDEQDPAQLARVQIRLKF